MKTRPHRVAWTVVTVALSWAVVPGSAHAAAANADAIRQQPLRTAAVAPLAAASCAACHGVNGAGNAATGAPRLAGLPALYIERQLAAYAEGMRVHPLMTPVARSLPAAQRAPLGTWFANRVAPWQRPAGLDNIAARQRARQLLLQGDERVGVQACVNCHGPGGNGAPPGMPGLNGQPHAYLSAALGDWKASARRTDPSRQMNMVAQRLSAADIAALAQYLADQAPQQ